jgi:type ISP restriction-modification system protein
LAESHGAVPQPEEVLAYVYAVLHDPGYRARYRELLRQDFARIPFPRERAPFLRLAALGRELIGLHLLEDPRLCRPAVDLAGPTEHPLAGYRHALPHYCEAEGRLDVNAQGMRFEGVTPGAWGSTVGGHPVLPRWLKARANRVLSAEEASTFCRIAAALDLTLAVQAKLAQASADQ